MRRFYNRVLYAAVMAVMGFYGCKDNDSSTEEKFSVTKEGDFVLIPAGAFMMGSSKGSAAEKVYLYAL